MPDHPRPTNAPVRTAADHRGLVFEALDAPEFAGQKNAHLVLTAPGCVRGNHYHRRGTEVAFVLGPALVRYRDGDAVVEIELASGEARRFDFPPGVTHAMQTRGDTPGVILSFNTEPHDPAAPDVVRDVLIEVP